MIVAIAGAHGAIARQLTRLLVARGDEVRGLIRNPAHAEDLREDGSEPVLCDLETVGADEVARPSPDPTRQCSQRGRGPAADRSAS